MKQNVSLSDAQLPTKAIVQQLCRGEERNGQMKIQTLMNGD